MVRLVYISITVPRFSGNPSISIASLTSHDNNDINTSLNPVLLYMFTRMIIWVNVYIESNVCIIRPVTNT